MTFAATVVRVLIASPSDLRVERDLADQTIHRWNARNAPYVGVILMPIRWETNASAEMGAAAQDVINRQIVDESDILVGMFWTRLGTPTASNVSGTAEELHRFLESGKPAALFVSRLPADLHTVDSAQFDALKAFLDEQRSNGLVLDFQTPEELAALVEDSLTRFVRERFDGQPRAAQAPDVAADDAQVRAEYQDHGAGGFVIITNYGAGEARNLTIDTSDDAHDNRAWELMGSDRPVDYLQPGASFQYRTSSSYATPQRVNCTVRWLNPDDTEGSSRQTLTM